jgi:hypothetical protein
MKATTTLLGSAILLAMLGQPAHAFEWVDDEIGLSWGPTYAEPGVASKNYPRGNQIEKFVVSVTHADGFQYGTNFFNIDILESGDQDPANNSSQGATEVYGVYRNVLSGNKISGTSNFSWGPIADIGWETGFDLETKNTTFAPDKRLIVFGPQFSLVIPSFLGGKDGFFNISLHGEQEWNNNGITSLSSHCFGPGCGGSVTFQPTFEMETGWSLPMPFDFFGYPVKFKGFANLVAPKGLNGFDQQTKTEVLVHPKLMVDLGEVFHGDKDRLEAGVGFEYWYNKFGNDHNLNPGCIQLTPLFLVSYKF